MKKTFILLVCMFVQLSVFANDDRVITFDALPQVAKEFVKKHFPNEKVARVEQDRDDKTYDLNFRNGCSIDFDKKGNWKEVDCKRKEVPSAIVPQTIKDYVKMNCKGERITKIELDRGRYEIELSSGVDIKFNKKFKPVDVDW